MSRYLDIADKALESIEATSTRYENNEFYEKSPNDDQDTIEKLEAIIAMRERGEIPTHYTTETTCRHCGVVPIWEGCPPDVLGCPWCFNRHKGLPIPRTLT